MSLLLLSSESTPNPRTLFANGEQGLAIDVEEAYLRGWVYQDAAGATVAAAAGDPVGLILDTSKGGLDQLGSDLVSNGTFASDTVWTKGANWTIGSGVATKTGGAANDLTQTIGSTAGKWYRITMDVTRTAGTLTVSLGTSGTTRAISATGSYTFFILAGSSTQTLTLAGDSSFAGTVDNVTARLVPGNHAYVTASGSRPVLARTPDGGRRNLLVQTEDFGSASWSRGNGATAVGKVVTYVNTNSTIQQNISNIGTPATLTIRMVASVASGSTTVRMRLADANDGSPASTVDCALTTTPTAFTNTATLSTGFSGNLAVLILGDSVIAAGSVVTISELQVEIGSSATAYQKVGLTSDVTESGKRDCWGLLFDGSDDFLQTASIDFSATDKMTVMAGVRKLSDAAQGIITELTTSSASNNGAFDLMGPDTAGVYYQFRSKGTTRTVSNTNSASFVAPSTAVLSGIGDISGDATTLRVNGAALTTDAADQGSGNYSNASIYIGARGGSSLRYNGLLYSLIIRGATTPTGTIADFERNLLARRCGVTF